VVPTPATIADTVIATADLSMLFAALAVADLVDTLQSAGTFTVFAPTNAAFDKLPVADLAALFADKAALTKVLTYHVVPGKVPLSVVVGLSKASTLEGSDVAISVVNGGSVLLNNEAKVIAMDIMASNGIVHLIDTVLIPPNAAGTLSPSPSLSASPATTTPVGDTASLTPSPTPTPTPTPIPTPTPTPTPSPTPTPMPTNVALDAPPPSLTVGGDDDVVFGEAAVQLAGR
jgi:hypothetical protein